MESGDILGGIGTRSRTVSLNEDKMEVGEEEDSSSSLSSSEWEDFNDGCGSPEGEADDEDDGAAAVRGAMRVGTRNMSHKEWDETNVDCYCPNRDIECFKVKVL